MYRCTLVRLHVLGAILSKGEYLGLGSDIADINLEAMDILHNMQALLPFMRDFSLLNLPIPLDKLLNVNSPNV